IDPVPDDIPNHHDGPLTGFAGSDWPTLLYLLVRVETDDGLVGWGEAFGYSVIPATAAVIRETLAPLAIGRDASNVAGLMEELKRTLHIYGRGGSTQYALGGLDIALWDLAGKRARRPASKGIGLHGWKSQSGRRKTFQALSVCAPLPIRRLPPAKISQTPGRSSHTLRAMRLTICSRASPKSEALRSS